MLVDREASRQTDRHTDRFNELANVSEFSFMSKKKKRMLESKLVKRSFAVINLTKGKKTLDRVTVNEFQNCALEKQEKREKLQRKTYVWSSVTFLSFLCRSWSSVKRRISYGGTSALSM